MKFFNATHEEKYNRYWNANVVSTDTKIKQILSNEVYVNQNTDVLNQLILQYTQHALNMIQNLVRQIGRFEDSESILDYLKASREQAIADLQTYQTRLDEYDYSANFSELIEALSENEYQLDSTSPAL